MTRRDPMLRSHQRAERQEMASTVRVLRDAGTTGTTGGDATQVTTVVYEGRATVTRSTASHQTVTAGGAAQTKGAYEVSVPFTTDVRFADHVVVDDSADDSLDGTRLRVVDPGGSDHATSRIVVCEAVQGWTTSTS